MENNHLECYIHYHEYDFNKERPTLILQGDSSSAGYDVDLDTLELKRVCICAAWSEDECICGVTDDML